MSTSDGPVVTATPADADLVLTADLGPDAVQQAGGWTLPAAALAVADALRAAARVPAEVLWPDAVTLPQPMCGGAGTARRVAVAVLDGGVLTVRLSLSGRSLDLPAGWTSVRAEGGSPDADGIAAAYAAALAGRLQQAHVADPALAADYRERCLTVGRLVEIDGRQGWISGVTADGGLVATVDGELVPVPPETPAVPA